MSETKIEMKIDEEIKPLKELCEKIVKMVSTEFERQNIEEIDTHEMYEIADIIKDLAEAKKYTVEACYKKYLLGVMEKNEDYYGDTWDEDGAWDEQGRRYYGGKSRSKTSNRSSMGRGDGRRMGYDEKYMPMDIDMYREDDREKMKEIDKKMGRRFYTESMPMSNMNSSSMNGNNSNGNNSRDSREGRSGMSRMKYYEHKDSADAQTKMHDLEDYMKDLSSDVTEMLVGATPEQKQMVKQKMQVLMQKF